MVSPATLSRKLKKAGSEVIVNPTYSPISRNIPRDIRLHHLLRAMQVLKLNQDTGRFTKTDFDTFVGPGAVNVIGDTSNRARPPNTTRRSLSSLTPEWAERYLPFPGRIYFTSAGAADLMAAVLMWVGIFNSKAIRGSNNGTKKNHAYKFSASLSFWVDGKKYDVASLGPRLESAGPGTTVKIINVAPHASKVELWHRVMYDATRATFQEFSPGIAIDYGFTNSDAVGLQYGKGTGGPSLPGRQTPVVYALPTVTMWIPEAGRSNARLRPFGMWKSGKGFTRRKNRASRSVASKG